MYKKITHTIVEEHFDHPIASQIKKTMEKTKLTNNDIFLESKFRSDIDSYFSSYINTLIALIDSAGGTDQDVLNNFENFFKTPWVDNIGDMTKPIYFTEFGEKLNETFRSIPITMFSAILSLKAGKDIGAAGNRVQFHVNELANNLSSYNNAWQYQPIANLMNLLFQDSFSLAKARVAKNATLDQQLTQKIISNWKIFEKLFIDGIITQHPERFTKVVSTIPTTADTRDIM